MMRISADGKNPYCWLRCQPRKISNHQYLLEKGFQFEEAKTPPRKAETKVKGVLLCQILRLRLVVTLSPCCSSHNDHSHWRLCLKLETIVLRRFLEPTLSNVVLPPLSPLLSPEHLCLTPPSELRLRCPHKVPLSELIVALLCPVSGLPLCLRDIPIIFLLRTADS